MNMKIHKQTIEDVKIMWFREMEYRLQKYIVGTAIKTILLPDKEYDDLHEILQDADVQGLPYWKCKDGVLSYAGRILLKSSEVIHFRG